MQINEKFTNPLADQLFSQLTTDLTALDSLADSALSSGITQYTNGNYARAIKDFQTAIATSPSSANAPQAAEYMAQAYLKMDDKTNAIKSFQRAIQLDPYRTESRLNLGNIYYDEEQYDKAVAEYEAAANVSPADSTVAYSLGQGYIKTEEYDKAEEQFRKVIRLEPNSASGNYGLGQAYAAQGRYDDAIEQFTEALSRDRKFDNAWADMGYAYADMGDMEGAEAALEKLQKMESDLADLLDGYIHEKEPPRIETTWSAGSTFNTRLSANTQVASLDSYLANANAEKVLTVQFQFSKEMDIRSVQNRYNWRIGREENGPSWERYNFGMTPPDTDTDLPLFPDYIRYDTETMTATVGFTIRQNDTADATIDPSHIVFQFTGKDADGNSMDPDADEFTGFSGVS